MPRPIHILTQADIRAAVAGKKSARLADGAGLYLLVKPDGSCRWRFEYRLAGKRRTLTLGDYPDISLDSARQRCAAARKALAQSRDTSFVAPGVARSPGLDARAEQLLARRHLLLQTIAAVNEMLMREVEEGRLMRRICRALVKDGLFRMAWIGLVTKDGVQVRPVAQAGRVKTYLNKAEIRCDDSPQGRGPTGTAIRLSRSVVNQDIEAQDGYGPWRERARRMGFRSSAATPIRQRQRVVGALNVYSAEPHAFGADEILLLEKLATDLGIAMERRAAESALRESEAQFRLLLDSSPEAIFGVDTNGVCTFVNPACLRMLGYRHDTDLLGKLLHPLMHHSHADGTPYPAEHCRIRRAAVSGQSTHADDEVYWRADGSSFPVEYWSHPMYRDGELIGSVVIFTDISERKRSEQALRESEERYRLISNVASDLLYSCVRGPDGHFRIDWATASVDRVFSYTLEEVIARGCWRCYVHPDDLPIFERNLTNLQPGQNSVCELRILAKDGSVRFVRAYSKVVGETSRHRLYGGCRDITDRKQAELALQESEARFRAMAEHSADWIWSMDLRGRHLFANHKGASLLGYELEELLRLEPIDLIHPDDRAPFQETFRRALERQGGWHNCVLRRRHRDGGYRVFESNASPLFNESQRLIGFQGVDRDITERREAEERIEFLAHHDLLTGLPNRLLLRDRFEQALQRAERGKAHVGLLFLDLDNFKMVNDTLGHATGDKLLQAVVARIMRCMRDTDTVCRHGGDEFILLLNEIPDMETVERIATSILAELSAPIEIEGHSLNPSGSIGVSFYPEDGQDFDSLLQKADAAMYSAKDAGRNTYRFFNEAMNLRAQEHLLLQNRMHRALGRGEFSLEYQPQLSVVSGRVFGVEALLRWHSPDLGQVLPSRFIPVAEDSGFIVPIGAWVLQEACRQAQVWRERGLPELGMSVNLSALQFRRGDLVETVASALGDSGFPPHLLELELTESILLQNVDHTLATVQRLKALGVRLAIDDFGTGYSSLSYLKRFTVDKLKIDQSFVRDIGTDPDDAAIVRAIIQMAKSLRLSIIAEGVETGEQLDFLQREGCPEVQGHYFSRPLSASALEIFLRRQRDGTFESVFQLDFSRNA
ncbi:MAG: EAL domain-containing protein [Thiohalobacteraceae bacterium]